MKQFFAQNPELAWVIIILAAWSLAWKGVALWRAARSDDRWWFIALLVVNTIGLLEILYLFVFSKRKSLAARADIWQR